MLGRAASGAIRQRIYSRMNRDVEATGTNVRDMPRFVTAAQWREDLDFLAHEMPRRFIYFDSFVQKEAFDAAVTGLREGIPSLTRDQVILELTRIVALAKAGHTVITPWQPAIDWRVLPLRFYHFDDGLYVTHASRRYSHTVGARVQRIGNAEVGRVLDEARRYIAADNDFDARQRFCQFFAPFPEFYKAFGYTNTPGKTAITMEDCAGQRFTLDVKPLSLGSPLAVKSIWPMYTYTGGVRPPEVMSNLSNRYWFEFWEDSKTVYFQFSGVRDNPKGETIAEFAERLRKFVDTHEFDRLIVDIRHNEGGDNTLVAPLVELFSGHKRINQRGRLFTIIDRETFSAAVSFATALERRTKTLFAGEPTGGHPNTIGDNAPLVLPNSKIIVRLSWRYWQQSAPEDTRRSIYPDLPVGLTHDDYFSGRDTAVEAILGYEHEPIQEFELSDAQKERFIGKYLFNPNQALAIGRKGSGLAMSITDFEEFAASDLHPVSETRLLADIADVEVRLLAGEDAPTVL
ncbi:MAG: hypothetical protein ACRDIB_08835, partial [Ardenticatenaceae bacterium]